MVCLDTDIMIAFLRGNKEAMEKIDSFSKFGIQLSTTPINVCELYIGAYKSKDSEENIKLVDEFLESIMCLNFDFKPCKLVGSLTSDLMKKGKFIGEMDVLISSLVLLYDEVLVTRNVKHFERIKGLRLEEW
ncbi:MAG: PIN domain-containing protein [Candidatus Aenigmarchaeota archaeon]|nr:PIN domain-containing protein [Candidatus Aenigmarchaeota archaeon]